MLDKIEELTGYSQSLQEEYKLSIEWDKRHGIETNAEEDKCIFYVI